MIAGSKAAKAQKHAANQQVAEYRREYDQPRRPRTLAGYGLGCPVEARRHVRRRHPGDHGNGAAGSTTAATRRAYGGFFTSPGYQFRLDQGNQAVQRSAAARGILGSGATMKAIDRYSQGLASSEYNNFSDRSRRSPGSARTPRTRRRRRENATTGHRRGLWQGRGRPRVVLCQYRLGDQRHDQQRAERLSLFAGRRFRQSAGPPKPYGM
jgi:hypothetical protein